MRRRTLPEQLFKLGCSSCLIVDTLALRGYEGVMKNARINIYVEDPGIRRRVKMAAAARDTSVSGYCAEAILEKLASEERVNRTAAENALSIAVRSARLFQKKAYAGKSFKLESAELIRQSRKERARS